MQRSMLACTLRDAKCRPEPCGRVIVAGQVMFEPRQAEVPIRMPRQAEVSAAFIPQWNERRHVAVVW